MIHKPIDNIMADDLRALVENGVREGRTIEYKVTLPETTDRAKKEFLADVTSFANAGGGDLIYGIAAKVGIPTAIPGLANFSEDQQLRLESLIRDGVDPRILGLRMHVVPGFDNGPVLIIRLPKSWASPHMVTFKNTSRFYTRSSAGKYQMDVTEIRSAFGMMGELTERIQRWRDDRLGKIVANEGPARLSAPSALVVHLIPLDSFANEYRCSARDLADANREFPPLGRYGWNPRINADGVLSCKDLGDGSGTVAYCQVFRSGRVEAVHSGVVSQTDRGSLFSGEEAESDVINGVEDYLKGAKVLDVPPPFVLCVGVLGAKGAFIPSQRGRVPTPIDRDPLVLPDVLLESHDCDVPREIRPILDAIWNALGFRGSPNYAKDGTWTRSG